MAKIIITIDTKYGHEDIECEIDGTETNEQLEEMARCRFWECCDYTWGISQRRVAVLCSENRINNVTMIGNMWLIPIDAEKPSDARSVRYVKDDDKKVKPFLKWAGGKGQLISEIEKYYPFDNKDIFKYAEPFVGGGAILFDILSKYDLKEVY